MSGLTEEQYEQVPEFLKNDYVKDGEEYVHAGLKKVKQTANTLDEKSKQTAKELEDYKAQEQSRIDAIKQEAYEKAVKENDTEALKKHHAEQLEFAKNSALEAGKAEAAKEFKEASNKAKGDNIALKIASDIGADEYAVDMLQKELRGRIGVDGDDVTILDVDGSATTLTQAEFKEEIKTNPRYSRLVKSDATTTGGGNVNGSGGGRTVKGNSIKDGLTERLRSQGVI